MFISKVVVAKMRQRNDNETAEQFTPQVNNAKITKTKSLIHKEMLFKDALVIPPHSLFRILSHSITPDSTWNRSNITGRQGTSNLTLKICLVALSSVDIDNKAIAVGKAVTEPMKLIHVTEGDSKRSNSTMEKQTT